MSVGSLEDYFFLAALKLPVRDNFGYSKKLRVVCRSLKLVWKKRYFTDICVSVNIFKRLIRGKLCLPKKVFGTPGCGDKSGG